MSLFNAANLVCPQCERNQEVPLVASVNAGRRPDIRAALLDRSFQLLECDVCGAALRLPLHMTYLDLGRGTWIVAEAAEHLAQWPVTVAEAQSLFDEAFGSDAPETAQEMARTMSPRVVFGWPALREKVICADLSLDDVSLELLKAALVKDRPGELLVDSLGLRLAGGTGEALGFELLDEDTEEVRLRFSVPRALYDAIADDPAWEPLRRKLDDGLFVDLRRLLLEAEEAVPA